MLSYDKVKFEIFSDVDAKAADFARILFCLLFLIVRANYLQMTS